jgi:transposase InsO family protein
MNFITKDLFAELEGQSLRHLERRIANGEVSVRWSTSKAANGRRIRECAVASLSAEAQLKLAKLRLVPEGNNAATSSIVQPALFASSVQEPDTLRTLSDEQRSQAIERYEQIKPLIEWCRDGIKPVIVINGKALANSNELAAWIGSQHGMTASGVWKRYMRLKKSGWDMRVLADKDRKDKGTSRVLSKYPKAAKFLLARFKDNISLAHAYDELKAEWPSLYNHGSVPPSYSTIRAYYSTLPPALRDAVKLTREKHDKRYAPYLVTDKGQRPNQIWVSDHRIHDVFAYNDVFEHEGELRAMRYWETTIIDMYSRVIVASVWNTTPSSRTIASALRMAISRFGLPEIFYVDNGKDYRKIGKGAEREFCNEPEELGISTVEEGLLARLGIKVQYCIPRHPQSKLIEPYYSYQSRRFDKIWGVSYAGSKPALRPDACHDAIREHKKFLLGQASETPLHPVSELIALANYWTDEYNTAHQHSGLNGRVPMEVFDAELPLAQRRTVDVTQIEELFWDRQSRRVNNCKIELNRTSYIPADEQTYAKLYLANGTDIVVACDPNSMGEALAFDQDHRYIGRLRSEELTARGPVSADAIKTMQRMRGKLVKASKAFWSAATAGEPTILEHYARRAGVQQTQQPRVLPAALPARLAQAVGATAPPDPRMYAEEVGEHLADMLEESN